MTFKIYGRKYDVKTELVTSSRNIIQQILTHVQDVADAKGIDDYYTAFVIMMYVASSSILKNINVDQLDKLLEGLDTEDEDQQTNDEPKQSP